jgi:Dolichyl-phosphate-mannose-protein mannosyltransferase
VPAGDYWVGLAFFAVTFGGCLGAAWLVTVRRLPALAGSTRIVAWALLATAAVLAAHLVPAVLGALSRETAALAAGLLLAAAWLTGSRAATPLGYPEPAGTASGLDRALGALGVAAFAIWFALVALKQLYAEPVGFDAVSAYLPTAANWLQEGSIWGVHDWLPSFFFGAAPGNGTVVLLGTMLPWDNDFLTHFAIYPFVVLTAIAIYALGREAGGPRPLAALIAVMLAAAPVVVYPALRDALLDPVLYFTFAAGLLFLVRHHRTGERADLVLAGVGLGIAFGTKFYGFTAVPIVIVIWTVARFASGVPRGLLARQAGILLVPVVIFGGVWVARNWIETGNPAYPVEVALGGVEIFDAPEDPLRERLGATLGDYLDDPSVWSGELREQFRIATGVPIALLGLAVLVTLAFLVRRRGLRDDDESDGPALTGVAAAAALGLSYALTPYSATGAPGDPILAAANVRYGIPALIAAAGVVAWLAPRLGRYALTIACALSLAGLFDALRIGVLTPRSTVYSAFAIAAVAVGVLYLYRRRRGGEFGLPAPPRIGERAALVAAASACVALAVFGARAQTTFNDGRYLGKDPVLDAFAEAADPARVGLAGSWTAEEPAPIYPAFGRRLQNEVEYVGRDADGLLTRLATRDEFVEALQDGSFDLLLIGLGSPTAEDPPRLLEARPGAPFELQWARSAGFGEIARSDRFALMAAQERAQG